MSKVLQRGTAMLALLIASVAFVTTAHAQMPASPWKKGAPFPVPDEELYGVAANGKLYVIGGWDDGKAAGVTYEYDPATDKWTKKQPMPRPAHHAALAAASGLSVSQLCVGVLLQTPGLTGVIVGARNARQGGVISSLGVGVTAEQAAAVWAIAENLAKDLVTL